MGTAHGHRMLAALGLIWAAIPATTAACDTSSHSVVHTAGPDCPAQLRYNGATYTAFQRYRFAHVQPTKLGSATSVCVGSTITAGDPITIWSLPGEPPAEVIGRRVYPKRFVVYVADSVKRSDRARILAAVAARRQASSGSRPKSCEERLGARCPLELVRKPAVLPQGLPGREISVLVDRGPLDVRQNDVSSL